ncbi:hypothetical protein FHS52_001633 [Erythromicrobium ramosum]|uniref:Uncharacterized protein n=1 Tax=Erythrobacter ramosus TaxID=35811 RepID=A0ABR6HYD6_9SPHN|nr:hypothetical protein [Erythrobacter ramosus]
MRALRRVWVGGQGGSWMHPTSATVAPSGGQERRVCHCYGGAAAARPTGRRALWRVSQGGRTSTARRLRAKTNRLAEPLPLAFVTPAQAGVWITSLAKAGCLGSRVSAMTLVCQGIAQSTFGLSRSLTVTHVACPVRHPLPLPWVSWHLGGFFDRLKCIRIASKVGNVRLGDQVSIFDLNRPDQSTRSHRLNFLGRRVQ